MNSMEVNLLKFRTFLAKMYRIENPSYENRRRNLVFPFREGKPPIHMVTKNKRMRIAFQSETTIENLPNY